MLARLASSAVRPTFASSRLPPSHPELARPAGTAPDDRVGAVTQRPIRVLCVEDNRLNVAVLAGLFEQSDGFVFEAAGDGPAALEAIARCRPDVVLLDINLPGMTGDLVFAHLRSMPDCGALPCIAISANALPNEIARFREIGFAAYLTKPFNLQHLMALVLALVRPPAGSA